MASARKTPTPSRGPAAPVGVAGAPRVGDPTLLAIERIRKEREARRKSAEHYQRERLAEQRANEAAGTPGDVDFQRLIRQFRDENAGTSHKHAAPGQMRVCVAVRKRPLNEREKRGADHDSVTILNPRAIVHACKLRVDGISKFLENQTFEFDHAFGENDSTDSVYHYTVQPLVPTMFRRGRAMCFAYGQTGSGKTYTMTGIQQLVVRDIYRLLASEEFRSAGLSVRASMFEIYGGRCSDLLHDRNPVTIREDGGGRVRTIGLRSVHCATEADLHEALRRGNESRTTHATAMNEVSSRSHSICQIALVTTTSTSSSSSEDGAGDGGAARVVGTLSLIDLAGSERASDRKSHNRQRRIESSEINKSLLALKECIRAMEAGSAGPGAGVAGPGAGAGAGPVHIPFRASKLTLALRDSFVSRAARIVMIAAVSPAASSADHTQNTLRYADRIKPHSTTAAVAAPGGVGSHAGAAYAGMGAPIAVDLQFLQKPTHARQAAPLAWAESGSSRGAPAGSGPSPSVAAARRPTASSAAAASGGAMAPSLAPPSRAGVAHGAHRLAVVDPGLGAELKAERHSSRQEHAEDEDEDTPLALDEDSLGPGGRDIDVDMGNADADADVDIDEDDDEEENDFGEQPDDVLDDEIDADEEVGGSLALSPQQARGPAPPAGGSDSRLRLSPVLGSSPDRAAVPGVTPHAGGVNAGSFDGKESSSASSSSSASAAAAAAAPPSRARYAPQSRSRVTAGAGSAGPSPNRRVLRSHTAARAEQGKEAEDDDDDDDRDASRRGGRGGGRHTVSDSADDDDGGVAEEFRSFASPAAATAAAPGPAAASLAKPGRRSQGASMSGAARGAHAKAAGAERSRPSPKKDLEILHETLKREGELDDDDEVDEVDVSAGDGGAGSGGGGAGGGKKKGSGASSWLEFHEIMDQIVEEEEAVLTAHMRSIQEHANLLTEEGQLLSHVQGRDVVDYDIDGYATRLDTILRRKMEITKALLDRLTVFRQHLRLEDELARRNTDAAPKPSAAARRT